MYMFIRDFFLLYMFYLRLSVLFFAAAHASVVITVQILVHVSQPAEHELIGSRRGSMETRKLSCCRRMLRWKCHPVYIWKK
jgi:hypothetical protein